MKRVHLILNLISLLLLLVLAVLYSFSPGTLHEAGLLGEAGKVVMLQLISFMLLLGALQNSLEIGWRRFCLAGCFLVLGQSVLLSILLPGI